MSNDNTPECTCGEIDHRTFEGCPVHGLAIVIHPDLRKAACAELDRWLDDCLRDATKALQAGNRVELGTVQFRASTDATHSLVVHVYRVHEKEL